MNNDDRSNTPLSIIILGSGYSGSGAVADYVAGRDDICDPLNGREFSIIQNPYGILPFYTSVYDSFYPTVAAEALNQLEWFLKQAGVPKRASKCGFDFNRIIIDYQAKVDRYIEAVTAVDYPFRNQFFLMKHGRVRSLSREFARRYFKRSTATMQRIPVTREAFLEITREFLHTLVADSPHLNPNAAGVIFNQAGSYWCPELSGSLFQNSRVIRVSRDPRDQFAELKSKKDLRDVDVFTKWYCGVMQMTTQR